jgi:uncharacterized phage-associated protein
MKYKTFGETKVQKLTFLAEWEMLDKRQKGFNYDFIRLTFGPYSPDLEKDIEWFENNGLVELIPIDEKTRIFRETSIGNKILGDFKDTFKRNELFTQKISEINRDFASMPLEKLLSFVYGLPHPYMKGKPRRIGELKPRTPILFKINEQKASVKFVMTPEELATLDIYLDKVCYDSIMQASESAKRKPLLSYKEVF